MLAAKKITESVTGPSSISVPLPPTIQPSSIGQAQQNNTYPLSVHKKQPNPLVQVNHTKMISHPPSAHNKHPNPPIQNRCSRMLPYPLSPHNKYPTYLVWNKCHPASVFIQHRTLPTPRSNRPVLP